MINIERRCSGYVAGMRGKMNRKGNSFKSVFTKYLKALIHIKKKKENLMPGFIGSVLIQPYGI